MSVAVENINSLQAYNSYMASLKRFNAETAKRVESKRGGHMTEWEAKEIKRSDKRENKQKEQLLNKIKQQPVKQGGKEVGYDVGERYSDSKLKMGGTLENAVKPIERDVTNMSKAELERVRMKMDKLLRGNYTEEKIKSWMRNYVKGLMRVGAPNDVIDMFMHVDPEQFQLVIDSDQYATIDFIYDFTELASRMQYIKDVWSQHTTDDYTVQFDLGEIRKEIEYESTTYGYVGRHEENWYKPYYQKRKGK